MLNISLIVITLKLYLVKTSGSQPLFAHVPCKRKKIKIIKPPMSKGNVFFRILENHIRLKNILRAP